MEHSLTLEVVARLGTNDGWTKGGRREGEGVVVGRARGRERRGKARELQAGEEKRKGEQGERRKEDRWIFHVGRAGGGGGDDNMISSKRREKRGSRGNYTLWGEAGLLYGILTVRVKLKGKRALVRERSSRALARSDRRASLKKRKKRRREGERKGAREKERERERERGREREGEGEGEGGGGGGEIGRGERGEKSEGERIAGAARQQPTHANFAVKLILLEP
eukprot:scaffold204318_cov28-Tisochrysis_lutea.AAC.1